MQIQVLLFGNLINIFVFNLVIVWVNDLLDRWTTVKFRLQNALSLFWTKDVGLTDKGIASWRQVGIHVRLAMEMLVFKFFGNLVALLPRLFLQLIGNPANQLGLGVEAIINVAGKQLIGTFT